MQTEREFAKSFAKLPNMRGERGFLPSYHILPNHLPNCWRDVLHIFVKNQECQLYFPNFWRCSYRILFVCSACASACRLCPARGCLHVPAQIRICLCTSASLLACSKCDFRPWDLHEPKFPKGRVDQNFCLRYALFPRHFEQIFPFQFHPQSSSLS